MTCVNCQNRIERALTRTGGVALARVSYADGRALVEYNPQETDAREIVVVIEALGYRVLPDRKKGRTGAGKGKTPEDDSFIPSGGAGLARGLDKRRVAGILIIVVAVFFILRNLGFTTSFGNIPLAEDGIGYGLLFVIGLLTSVHCIAMCGGINISQCVPAGARNGVVAATFTPSLKYNLARVCSYTAVGAIVGGIGSAISLSGDMKGLIQLIAGVFMVIMGLSMFGVLPGLGRLVPRMPRVFGDRIESAKSGGKGPVVVGLLNGLMPCGPLQAMQIFALSTSSPVQGAVSMLCFSLGTVPLMFGLGALSSILGGRFTSRAMTVGAALVIFLGLFMFTQGLTLSGVDVPGGGGVVAAENSSVAEDSYTDSEGNSYATEDGVQVVRSVLGRRGYPHITVKAGVPVHWIIDAPDNAINGCNGAIYIPEYGVEHTFEPGENVIDFTPDKSGEFMYSCWMGMITSYITVEA
jgi:sulfite exporter TauE/SafE/copper chaperone CopZ